MGKSGSGKSSMRSIIFSNYVAKDVRRLGATIDVEHTQFKFLGSLLLNLWDCGGCVVRVSPFTVYFPARCTGLTAYNSNSQDAFTETYLGPQKSHMFSDVGVLIYVFDVESRSLEGSSSRDLATYANIIGALQEYSPSAHVFALIHKMDLVLNEYRDQVIGDKTAAIKARSGSFGDDVRCYGTSIWDQTLYAAWGDIVQCLTPNLGTMKVYLEKMVEMTRAEEIILFERATFLKVANVTTGIGERNPYSDRYAPSIRWPFGNITDW